MFEKRSRLTENFTIEFASNLCSLKYGYFIMVQYTIQYNIDVYTGGIMHYKEGLPKPPVVKKD